MVETDDRGPEATAGEEETGSRSLVVASLLTALRSDSWLLRSYGVVSLLLAVFVVAVVILAFPVWVANSLGSSPTITFSRAFLLLSGMLVVAALFAPVVYARRRHRRGDDSRQSDFLLAGSGYLFVFSLYLSLVISAPPSLRSEPSGVLAPVVDFLYSLDPVFALVPPVVAVAAVVVAGTR